MQVEMDKQSGCGGHEIKYTNRTHNISVRSGGSFGFEIQTLNDYTYKIINLDGSISRGSFGKKQGSNI